MEKHQTLFAVKPDHESEILVIGAGAAGLSAAIFAAEAAAGSGARILLLEGAKKPGAKILISGGGRCNVTNQRVTEADFCGGPPNIIRKVLKSFDERRTLEWFESLGVPLKLEPTGKYFPISNQARSVLDALFKRAEALGVRLISGARVVDIRKTGTDTDSRFVVKLAEGRDEFRARRLILATGGLSLPKTGSDGWGLNMTRKFGHTIIPTTPALSPLLLNKSGAPGGRFHEWSGITMEARLTLLDAAERIVAEQTGSLLFTHFGISGPVALDISRHLLRARLERPGENFELTLGVPGLRTPQEADAWLLHHGREHPRRTATAALGELLPERLAKALAEGLPSLGQLTREQRLHLARNLARMPLEVTGDRGYASAEVTAGGVDLREIDVRTMESRRTPGLYLCGEMLDVDGRIGGFNFQWAWASGYLAGRGAATGLTRLT